FQSSAAHRDPPSFPTRRSSDLGGADFRIVLNQRGTRPESGTATLQFCRTVAIAGELAGARMAAEIENTLRQFTNITNVVILTKRSEEHTSELQSLTNIVCRLLL